MTPRSVTRHIFENDRAWHALAFSVIAFQIFLALNHAPWRDEFQALQIALQSPDVPALLANLHYEGHPPLWYMILRGAAIVIPAAWVLAITQAVIGGALQTLILFRATAPRWQRLLVATSYFMLIDYGAISRSLSLGVLLFTAAMLLRSSRLRWLSIVLMPITDFLFGALSLVAIALLARERRIWRTGLIFWAISAALAAWSVTNPADILPAAPLDRFSVNLAGWLERLSTLLIPFPMNGWRPQWGATLLPEMLSVPFGLCFLVFADRQFADRPFERVLLYGIIAVTAGLSTLVYPLSPRHLTVIAWTLILLRWHADRSGAKTNGTFGLWLTTVSACGLIAAAINLATPFDISARAATYIDRERLQNEHWIAYPFFISNGLSALTGTDFDRLQQSCTQSFVRWNHRDFFSSEAELESALRHMTTRYGRSFLVTSFRLDPIGGPRYIKALPSFTGGYDGDDLFLYEIGANLPRSAARPKPCAPRDRLPLALLARADDSYLPAAQK